MVAAPAEMLVRLHVDHQESVWYGDPDSPAVNTGLDVPGFFESDHLHDLDDAHVIRFLGTARNAPLVVKLQERRHSSALFRHKKIQIGSPAILPASWVQADPGAVVQYIWQLPPSATLVGHWHDMTIGDYAAYAVVVALGDRRTGPVPEMLRRIARHHPAWPALTFLAPMNEDAACRLLADVIDPRWFTHHRRVGRLNRLYAHLGLTPDNMLAVAGCDPRGRHYDRALTAVNVWYNTPTGPRSPSGFLFRDFAAADTAADGLLAGTRRMVRFVATYWLWAVGPQQTPADDAVRPVIGDGAAADAFVKHLRTANRV